MTEANGAIVERARAATPALLWLSCIALMPFGRSAELAIGIAALLGLGLLWRAPALLRTPAGSLAGLLFLGYWLPEILSALDAVEPSRAWREVLTDLRYAPMLLYFSVQLARLDRQRLCAWGLLIVLLFWCLDAWVQVVSGWSLGGPVSADRLSGIFGAEDLKLGAVLAVLSPFLLAPALARSPRRALLALALLGGIVLLAGTRAAWVMLGLVVAVLCLRHFGWRRGGLGLLGLALATLLLGWLAYLSYPPFAERVDRSAAVLSGDSAGLDHALAFRLPIWSAAWAMTETHPVNGVGIRGFRYAYPQFAGSEDPWLDFAGADQGAAHPHQLVLELLAETGLIGLTCWLLASGIALRRYRRLEPAQRRLAGPAGLALLALLFPLNTHYAVYSSAWGGLLLSLLALWIAALYTAAPPRGTGPAA